MMFRKLVAVTLALLMISAVGVAAVGTVAGNASYSGEALAQEDDPTETPAASDGGPPDHANNSGNATAEQAREERGPPIDMPSPVPAFVSEIHQAIWEHLNGNITGAELGQALSSLTPGDDPAEATDNADANATATGTPTPTPTPEPTATETDGS